MFAYFHLPIDINNRSTRLERLEAAEGARSCYRLTALFFSSKKVFPRVPRSASRYGFFRRCCVPEGNAAKSQVSSGNTGQSIFHLFGAQALSVFLKPRKKGLRRLLPAGAYDPCIESASALRPVTKTSLLWLRLMETAIVFHGILPPGYSLDSVSCFGLLEYACSPRV